MLQLYYYPLAASLASRIALMEAGIPARYHLMHLWDKTIVETGADYLAIAPKGAVPMLVLEDGATLTENAAVLQYIADLAPERGLAPPAGTFERYRLQEWLSFVGTEIHKGFLYPSFWYDEAAKAGPRERIGRTLSVAAAHLATRPYLVGDRFTVADAHLTWALFLLPRAGVDLAKWPALADYLARMRERPQVRAAIETEKQESRSLTQPARAAAG